MEVVVFGAGSLGSLIGGLLARTHEVTLVGREPHVGAVERDGLRISGEIETTVHPDAATEPPANADLAVVTVKSYDTDAAAAALADCDLRAALSLQNGLGNEAILAEDLDCPVLAGTCTYGARLVGPGQVACTGVGDVVLGPREGGQSSIADEVGSAFDAADVETTVADDMPERLWEKLAVNAAINPVTALARVENGALTGVAQGVADDATATADSVAGVARAAARETAAVARASGIDLSDERAVAAVERVVADTAANRSSMLQDVDAGRRTEIDAINGAVVDRARDLDRGESGPALAVPVNATLAALVRAWETGRGLR